MILRYDFLSMGYFGVWSILEYFGVWSILEYGVFWSILEYGVFGIILSMKREGRNLKSRITRYSRPAKGFITLQNIGHFYMIFMASASCLFG